MITYEEIEKLAELSKLSLDLNQKTEIQQQLQNTLKLIDLIQQFQPDQTQQFIPQTHINYDQQTVALRTDKVIVLDQRKALAPLAPVYESNLYLVPRVIK